MGLFDDGFDRPGQPEVTLPEAVEYEFNPERRASCRYRVGGVTIMIAWQPAMPVSPPASSRRWPGDRWGSGEVKPLAERAADATSRGSHAAGTLDRNGFVRQSVRLMDLSQTGLCVLAEQPAPGDRTLWIGINEPIAISWSEVVLRSLSTASSDEFLLRLSFVSGCPYDFFSAMILKPGLPDDANIEPRDSS